MLHRRTRWLIVVSAILASVTLSIFAAPALRAVASGEQPKDYLALGDSVAFGTNPLLDVRNANNFIGFPTPVASTLHETLTNAACPGEATGGFISRTGVDNVCRPYRARFPLHVAYTGTQLDFAVAFLKSHPHTQLVTLIIGANDLFVLQKQCASAPDPTACTVNGLPTLLATISSNLDIIFGAIRNDADYHHKLVAVTYYSLDYRDAVGTGVIAQINAVIADRVRAWDGRVADGFAAFATAANNGDTCAAGLRIALPKGGCDIHPSVAGRNLLAQAVLTALRDDGADTND